MSQKTLIIHKCSILPGQCEPYASVVDEDLSDNAELVLAGRTQSTDWLGTVQFSLRL